MLDQAEEGVIGSFVYQKPDNRKARLTTQINLIMSDALRDMTLAALDSYGTFLLEHAKHDTHVEDAEVPPYQPLFVLEVISAGQGELFYSTASQQFVDDPLRLLDEALGALGSLQTADIFDISLTEVRELCPFTLTRTRTRTRTLTLISTLTLTLTLTTYP